MWKAGPINVRGADGSLAILFPYWISTMHLGKDSFEPRVILLYAGIKDSFTSGMFLPMKNL
jgi:hypothetical protein